VITLGLSAEICPKGFTAFRRKAVVCVIAASREPTDGWSPKRSIVTRDAFSTAHERVTVAPSRTTWSLTWREWRTGGVLAPVSTSGQPAAEERV
jgi:hypothetical protein